MSRYRSIVFIVFLVLLIAYYLGLAFKVTMNSDGATGVLQAKDMMDGNIFLRDWYLSTGAYITTDLLFYIIAIMFLGVSSNVIYVISALFYAGLVGVSVFLSAKEAEDFSYKRAFVTFSLMGLPCYFLSNILFSGPMHTSSLLYCVVALFAWEHAKNIYVKYSVFFILITLTLISDPFAIWFFVLPYSLACLIRSYYDRRELYTLGTVVLSYIVAKAVLFLIGFNIPSVGATRFFEINEIWKNITLTIEGILELYKANFFGKSVSLTTMIVLLHLAILIMVCLVIYRSVKKMDKPTTLELFLILAVILNIAEYAVSNMPINLATTRYLIPAYVFLAIYVGKYAIYRIVDNKLKNGILIAVAVFAITSIQSVTYSKPKTVNDEVIALLNSKGLKNGYGSYWNSSINTLESGGSVSVRPIVYENTIAPFGWLSKKPWYNEESHFVLFDTSGWGNINLDTVTKTFGKPDETYTVQDRTILYWKEDISKKLPK